MTQGATGVLGNTAYSFDGTDDYVSVSDSASLDGMESLTLSFWTNVDSFSGSDDTWINKDDSSFGSRVYRIYRENGQYVFALGDGAGNYSLVAKGGSTATGTWVFVACTFDGSTGRVFVDGVEVASASNSQSVADTNTSVNIGRTHDGNRNINGSIAEVRVYDHVLTASEVQYLFSVSQHGQLTSSWKQA